MKPFKFAIEVESQIKGGWMLVHCIPLSTTLNSKFNYWAKALWQGVHPETELKLKNLLHWP